MCTKLLVINKLYLGNRELGYELYDLTRGEVIEMTAGQIKQAIKGGKNILGVKVSSENELIPDSEGYYMRNLMKKVHINKLEPLYECESSIANMFYYVTGTVIRNSVKVYKVVNSRFGREEITEEKLKALYELGVVAGGVKVEQGKVTVSEYIEHEEKDETGKEKPLEKEVKQEKDKKETTEKAKPVKTDTKPKPTAVPKG